MGWEGTFYLDSWVKEEGFFVHIPPVVIGEVDYACFREESVAVVDCYCEVGGEEGQVLIE